MSLARSRITLLILGAVVLLGLLGSVLPASATTYYIDNQTDFDTYKAATFAAGDEILFARGASFIGSFAPQGSGTAQNPIVIDAYGTGPLPKINTDALNGIDLVDVSGWEVNNLEIYHKLKGQGAAAKKNGAVIWNSQDYTTLEHFVFRNLVIHDLAGNGSTGITTCSSWQGGETDWRIINDVTIDGCTIYDMDGWAMWNGGSYKIGDYSQQNDGITIRNNTVYNTWVPMNVDWWDNILVENNVGHDTYSGGYAVPYLEHCRYATWQNDEYYNIHTNENDGGALDIDSCCVDVTLQYCYGHDCDGYGVHILGNYGVLNTGHVVRYNILANNGRQSGVSGTWDYGEINFWCNSVYSGEPNGEIGAFSIYNNTLYHNPAADVPAISQVWGGFAPGYTRFMKNNIVYSTTGYFMYAYSDTAFDYNLYWNTGGTSTWKYGGLWNSGTPTTYTTFASYKSGSGQDANGQYADPQFVGPISPAPTGRSNAATAFALDEGSPAINAGTTISGAPNRDFIGNAIVGSPDIGALESSGEPTPPPAPTGLTATPGDQQVELNWNASPGATSYKVKRSETSGGPYDTIETGVTETTYTDTGLTNYETYYYVVTAVNSAGESPNSNEASATPEAPPIPDPPTGLTATPGNEQVELNWNASSGATSYKVYRGTTSGDYDTVFPGITDTSYTDTGLTNGVTYYYAVTAVNSSGESGYSNEASATPQEGPDPPTNLTASVPGQPKKIDLAWDASPGAESYNVYHSLVSGGPYNMIETGITETYIRVYADPGMRHYYVVTAVADGLESGYSNEASAIPKG